MSKTQAVVWAAVPNGTGIATAQPGLMAPLAAANINGGEQALLLVANLVAAGAGSGSAVSLIGLTDNADNVAPLTGGFINLYQGSVARLTGYDPVGNNYDRLRTAPDNADGQAALGLGVLAEIARAQGWNGATWDRLKTLSAANLAAFSGVGGLMSAEPGEWAIQNTPAAATQATITRAAGGAGVRHVCRSITVSVLATAAQGQLIVNLRDGATGAGTILWSAQFALAAGTSDRITLGGLNIVGSANTAMTLETAAAPAATNFASVSLSGYDAS